jgi:hypothetical protein
VTEKLAIDVLLSLLTCRCFVIHEFFRVER